MGTFEQEQRIASAVNGMRARRFGGAINYAMRTTPTNQPAPQPMMQEDETPPVTQHYSATPVQAPGATINTQMPQGPNVQPTAPVSTNRQSAQPQGVVTPNPLQQRLAASLRNTPKPMPARPGVTANPLTDPYAYIEQMYGPRETAEERAARERREYKHQQINNWLGMLGALGNMVVTSSSRYGRAVKSPDLAEAADKGIMTRELQRREREEDRLAAVQRQQQLDAQREKARRDAEERAWNRRYKMDKDAADDKWRREKSAADDAFRREQLAYQQQRDADRLSFDKDKARQQRRIDYKRLAEQRKNRESREDIEKVKIAVQAQRAANGRANRDDVVLPVPGYQHGLHVAKGVWNGPTRKLILGMLVSEAEEQRKKDVKAWRENEEKTDLTYKWFKTGASTPKPRNWFDVNFGGVDDSSTDEDMILAYIATHVDSEASKQAIKMLEDMSYDGGGNPRYDPDNNFYDEDDPWTESGGTFW